MNKQNFKHEEESAVFAALQAGDPEAKAFIVEENEKLVHSIAGKYATNERYSHEDLFQQGVIGLLMAAESFDTERGVKFSSYAYKVIENAILDYMYSNACQLSVSANAGKNYLKSKSTDNESKDMKRNALLAYRFISIDDADADENAAGVVNIVQDTSPTPEETLDREFLLNEINTAINKLRKDDAKIIRSYYGIKTQKKTLDEIANEYKISKQAVSSRLRTIQKKLRSTLKNLL